MVRFFERRALCFRYGIGVRLLSTNITRVSLTLAPKRTICNWLMSASAFFLTDPLYFGEIGTIRLLAVIIFLAPFSVFRITTFIPSEDFVLIKYEIVINTIGAKPSVQFTESPFPHLVYQFANHSLPLSLSIFAPCSGLGCIYSGVLQIVFIRHHLLRPSLLRS